MFSLLRQAFATTAVTTMTATAPALTSLTASNAVLASNPSKEIATFASGCFWGTEHIFLKYYKEKGILKTTVGYIGGNTTDPQYRAVCAGDTGHAESLQIEFDPAKVTYPELVEFFYRSHDPTTVNRQGGDTGTQYRSAIFYHTPEQLEQAKAVTADVQKDHFDLKGKKIVTEILEAGKWWDAETYHQQYLHHNPNGYQCPTHRLHW